jgi:hypothetical protein
MALVVNDRVKETSTTTGTGTFSLAGAVTGFETFVAGIGNSNTTYYAIVNTNNGEFEVGLGTVTDATPDTLARTTIISSSNSDSAVDFSSGTKNVFCTLPASKSVILDASGNIVANNGSNLTALNATQLTSGTVPDARFPATLPALNGSALTNLNATALASGTVANARLDAQLQDVAGLATTAGKIIQGDGSNFALSAYTLPTSDGSANQVLTTDGSGAVTFATPTVGDITGVTAGSGLAGGGTSGDVTLNVGAGTGVTVNANDIAIGQSVATSASPTFAGLTTTADINFGDSDKARFGAGQDLEIFHDGSNSYLQDVGTGELFIKGSTNVNIYNVSDNEPMAIFTKNGPVDLYYDNAKKFETKSDGINITGTVYADGLSMNDNEIIYLGNSADLRIYHDGSNSYVNDTGTGNLFVNTNGTKIALISDLDSSNGKMAEFTKDGAVELYYDNSKKFETVTGGATVTGTMTATTFSGSGASLTSIPNGALDNSAITINGTSTSLGGSINVGDITGVTAGTLLDGGGTSGSVTLNVDLSELTTSTSNGDGDFFCVVDSANAQKKLTKGNINISGFNNDSGFSTTTGTVTSVQVTPGTGLDGGGTITTSGNLDVTLDLSELTDMTATMTGSDEFIVLDSGAERRKAASEIGLSIFNNDAGFTTNTGDITSVVAGDGLTGGATSGAATLNVGAGTGIDVAADAISVDVSDFMSNGSNNRVVTATGTDGMNAEANMTFDGTDLSIPQNIVHLGDTNCYFGFHATDQWRVVTGGTERFEVNSSSITAARNFVPGANDTYDLGASGNVWRNIYTGDLHLSNEAKDEGNAVDGTKGNWTIQEGEEHLYILNNKNGKKYKFKLEEM